MSTSVINARVHWYMASWKSSEMKLKFNRIDEKNSSRFFHVLELASDFMFKLSNVSVSDSEGNK